MLASELVKRIQEEIKLHGDVVVTTFDLDRDICAIDEVGFCGHPFENIYIG